MTRRLLAAWMLVVPAIAVSCGRRPVAVPAPPSGSLVVLLPDPDEGSVGRVNVSNAAGAVELSAARDATRVATGQAPSVPAPMDAAEVTRIFGDALASLPRAPRHFILYFQFDSDELTDESRRLLPEVRTAIGEYVVPDVVVVGHTDTMGTNAGNYQLGLRRATIIRDLLVSGGLDASLVEVASHGEADPVVRTPDETGEARNRRVEIEVK
jgi:outer membrane protein OmpA-like peptidoglycan-associated protein